jgi:hypothetical protein
MKPRNPRNATEWQEAADAAHAVLVIDSARMYGLVTGGPGINRERCEWILEQARRRGIRPAKDAPEKFLAEWQAQCREDEQRKL